MVLERGCRFDQERGAKLSLAVHAHKVGDGVLDPTDRDGLVSRNADSNAGIEETLYVKAGPISLATH